MYWFFAQNLDFNINNQTAVKMKNIIILLLFVLVSDLNLYSESKTDSIYADLYELLVRRDIAPSYLKNEMPKNYFDEYIVEKLPNNLVIPKCEFKEYFGIYRIRLSAINYGDNLILIKKGDEFHVFDQRDVVLITRHLYNIAKDRQDLIPSDDIASYLKEIIYPKDYGGLYVK